MNYDCVTFIVLFDRGDFLGFGGPCSEWPNARQFATRAGAEHAARGYDLPSRVVTGADYKAGRV